MKQTVVEWLEEKLIEAGLQFTKGEALEIEQAKEMEKEQIIDAYKKGFLDCDDIGIMSYDEYYTETFKNK